MTRRSLRGIGLALAMVMLMMSVIAVAAQHESTDASHNFADADFWETWARTDKPVVDSVAPRTWMWGPTPITPAMWEANQESPGTFRSVQYFDKSRMEINQPDAFDDDLWYVTNGLLVVEMVDGSISTGDGRSIDSGVEPAAVNITGDPGDETGPSPTYADIDRYSLRDRAARPDGSVITQRIDGTGKIVSDASLTAQGVTSAQRVQVPGIDHQVASVFWTFMLSEGPVFIEDPADEDVMFGNGTIVNQPLFASPYYATGYPITEAYWSNVIIGGEPRDVLWQCFERRCLTYTPGNPAGFLVEAGNVGQHYHRWRYPDGGASLTAPFVTTGPSATLSSDSHVTVTDATAGITLNIDISDAASGWHGVHLYEKADCSAVDTGSAGGHLSLGGQSHGEHAGDLPNIWVGDDGNAQVTLSTVRINSIAQLLDADGSALVVHANADDYTTQPDGNSGSAIACAELAGDVPPTGTATATTSPTASATATATEPPTEDINLFLIQLGTGSNIACGDSIVSESISIPGQSSNEDRIRVALEQLFSLDNEYYGNSYNALHASNLSIESVSIESDGDVSVALTGSLNTDGLCNTERAREQIRRVIAQFVYGEVRVYVDGNRVVPAFTPDFYWQWIDAEDGGSINIPGQIEIIIPPNALTHDALITVDVESPATGAQGLIPVSHVWDINVLPVNPGDPQPDIASGAMVELRGRYNPSMIPSSYDESDIDIYFFDTSDDFWNPTGGSVMPSSDTVVNTTDHFSRWSLFL